jgi:hypothetical protein
MPNTVVVRIIHADANTEAANALSPVSDFGSKAALMRQHANESSESWRKKKRLAMCNTPDKG